MGHDGASHPALCPFGHIPALPACLPAGGMDQADYDAAASMPTHPFWQEGIDGSGACDALCTRAHIQRFCMLGVTSNEK